MEKKVILLSQQQSNFQLSEKSVSLIELMPVQRINFINPASIQVKN